MFLYIIYFNMYLIYISVDDNDGGGLILNTITIYVFFTTFLPRDVKPKSKISSAKKGPKKERIKIFYFYCIFMSQLV